MLAVEILRDMRNRCGALGALTAGHALRPRGRARRIEHDRPSLGIDARLDSFCARADERLKRKVSCARIAYRDARASARFARRTHRLGGDLFVDDRLRLGVFEAEIQLARTGAPIQRGDDDAGELAGPVDRRCFPAVLQQRDEMIARPEPEVVEAGDERRNLLVPHAIGQAQFAVDDRQRVGIARDTRDETRAEIKHGSRVPLRSMVGFG